MRKYRDRLVKNNIKIGYKKRKDDNSICIKKMFLSIHSDVILIVNVSKIGNDKNNGYYQKVNWPYSQCSFNIKMPEANVLKLVFFMQQRVGDNEAAYYKEQVDHIHSYIISAKGQRCFIHPIKARHLINMSN